MPLSGFYRQVENFIRRGTAASRPAVADVLPGSLYYVTDENTLERSTGSAWESVHPGPVEQTTTSTGTQNNFDLSGRETYLRCNNASALVLTGLTVDGAAPTAGDVVIIENIGTSTVRVAHQNGSSTAENRVICSSTNGQIVGAGGRMLAVYDGTTDRWRLSLVDKGSAISVTFAAGDFTGFAPMTWTVESGDLSTFKYYQHGKSVTILLSVETSTLGGTASGLVQVALPNGFTVSGSNQIGIMGRMFDNSAWTPAVYYALPATSTTVLLFGNMAGTNLTLVTNALALQGTVTVEVD